MVVHHPRVHHNQNLTWEDAVLPHVHRVVHDLVGVQKDPAITRVDPERLPDQELDFAERTCGRDLERKKIK